MARYIDADALKERLEYFSKWCRDGRKQGVDFVLDCPLPDMPTADVVEVVRCGQCKYCRINPCNLHGGYCRYCDGASIDHYCSYGERKKR